MSEPNEVKQNEPTGSNEPSSSTEPTGSLGAKAKRGAVNGVKNGIQRAWRAIPLKLRLLIAGVGIVVILVFIFLMAIFNYALTTEKSDTAIKSADSYVSSSNFKSGDTAKKNYEEKASLLLFKLEDINGLYDETLKSSRDSTKADFSYVLGKNDVADDKLNKRIVDPDDKLPIYKHILLTEKYNFNKINWKIYGHEYNGEEIESVNKANIKMKEDTDLGIKYPDKGYNEDDYKADKFIDMTYPMLQNWYIPLAFLSASTTKGTEETANNPQLAYNIIKEAYSKIVVNRYDTQKLTLKTKYTEIDKVTKNNIFTIQVNKRKTTVKRLTGSPANMAPNTDVNYIVAPFDSATYPDLTSALALKVESKKEHLNSRWNSKKEEDPMKEDKVSENVTKYSKYFVKEAKTFDVKIINEFNYIKYSEEDTKKRINSDTETIKDTEYKKDSEHTDNDIRSIAVDSFDSAGYSSVQELLQSKFPGKKIKIQTVETLNDSSVYKVKDNEAGYDRNGNHTYNLTVEVSPYAKYEVKIEDSYIDYENGVTHNVTRTWEDKLSQIGSTNSPYTIDDLIEYNNSDDREEKVSAEELCGSSYSSSSSSAGGSSTGTPTTEFTLNGKTYKVFGQQRNDSCSLCSTLHAAIAVKPSEYGSYDENKMINKLNWTGPLFLSQIADNLTNTLKIPSKVRVLYRQTDGKKTEEIRKKEKDTARKEISAHLKTGNPVIILVKECHYAGMNIGCHYTTLVGYDTDGKGVLCCDSAGGGLKVRFSSLDEALGCMFDYMNYPVEDGYVLVNYGQNSTTGNSANSAFPMVNAVQNLANQVIKTTPSGTSKSNSTSSNLSDQDKKMQDLINYAVSLEGKVPYTYNNSVHKDESSLISNGTDCAGFVASMYYMFYDVNFKECDVNGVYDMVGTANKVNKNGLHGRVYSFDSSKGYSQLQPGDVIKTEGHIEMYLGSYNGVPSIISQSGDSPDPDIRTFESEKHKIKNYIRYIDDNTKVTGVNGSVSSNSSSSSSSNSSSTVCNTEDGQYYKLYEKNKELNLIDFMNSNPGIYKKYLGGDPYSKYIGYPRAYLVFHYGELKRLFTKIQSKNEYLPFVYGQSLGFGTELTEGEGAATGIDTGLGSGLEAMCQKAIELANENGGKGLWHYCQGSAGGQSNHEDVFPGRFSFKTIDELEKYVDLAKKNKTGKKNPGTDCGAFVRSMYLAYTGVDIDPGGGSGITSVARTNNGKKLPNNPTITVHYYDLSDYDKLQPGDVLSLPGHHVGLYVGKINGKHMQVDQGGGNVSGNCGLAVGTSWRGPDYHEVGSSYTNYIHYEGLPSGSGKFSFIEDFIFDAEGITGIETKNGKKCYKFVIGEYDGDLAIGHGQDFYAGGLRVQYIKAGYAKKVSNGNTLNKLKSLESQYEYKVALQKAYDMGKNNNHVYCKYDGDWYEIDLWVPVDFVDSVTDDDVEYHYNQVKKATSGLNLKEYQLFALTSRNYQYGNISGFCDAYKSYWKAGDLKEGQKDKVDFNHLLYINFFSTIYISRCEGEWTMFQTGYNTKSGKYYGK